LNVVIVFSMKLFMHEDQRCTFDNNWGL